MVEDNGNYYLLKTLVPKYLVANLQHWTITLMNLMSQNSQIVGLQEENSNLKTNVRYIDDELGETKLKLYNLEYEVKQLEKKNNYFPLLTALLSGT